MFPDDLPPGGERSSGFWDTSGLLPIPRRPFGCPMCAGDMALKDWKFHKRKGTGSANPCRCDVRLKCMCCGYVATFGVLVSQDMFARAKQRFAGKFHTWIHWRDGRSAMEVDDG